jgi:putative ABC transport system permease protein
VVGANGKGDRDMKEIMDIDLLSLLLAFSIMLIPIAGFIYYRVPLVKDTAIALVRMSLQLSLVAVYLEYIFKFNSIWLNTLWVVVMILIAVYTSINRMRLNFRMFIIPFLISGFTSVFIIDAFFLGYIIKLDYIFDARYFIPISGMVLGNAMNHNIVGLTAYFDGLVSNRELYYYLLVNNNNRKAATAPFIREGLRRGLNPLVATMTVMGLISLPGMMTGQILGGSSPAVAIKYQIMIMLAIFAGVSINLLLSVVFSNRFIFDSYDRLRKNIFNGKK